MTEHRYRRISLDTLLWTLGGFAEEPAELCSICSQSGRALTAASSMPRVSWGAAKALFISTSTSSRIGNIAVGACGRPKQLLQLWPRELDQGHDTEQRGGVFA